jgi:hypothetical protein
VETAAASAHAITSNAANLFLVRRRFQSSAANIPTNTPSHVVRDLVKTKTTAGIPIARSSPALLDHISLLVLVSTAAKKPIAAT